MAPVKVDSPALCSGGPSYMRETISELEQSFIFRDPAKNMCQVKPSSDSFGWYRPSNKSDPLLHEIPTFGKSGLFSDPNQPAVFIHWRLPPITCTMKSLLISSMTITWPNLWNCSDTTVVLDSDSAVGNTMAFQCNKYCPVISPNISFLAHGHQLVSKEWHLISLMYATMTKMDTMPVFLHYCLVFQRFVMNFLECTCLCYSGWLLLLVGQYCIKTSWET